MSESDDLQKLLGLPLLRYVPNMPEATGQCIARLFLAVGQPATLSKGDILLRQGGLGGDVGFILLEGSVEVEKEGEKAVAVCSPALLGEMHQLNPRAQRTATVRAKGDATVLQFSWQEFYTRAKDTLAPEERLMLAESIERCVLERFDRDLLLDLRLFRGLPDELKLRVCLMLQWESQRMVLADGEVLFKEDSMCGDTGYLLAGGQIQITKSGRSPQILNAPTVIGVMPEFNPELRWTATASAKGQTELQRFPWLAFLRTLQSRLRPEEQRRFLAAIQANMPGHFVH